MNWCSLGHRHRAGNAREVRLADVAVVAMTSIMSPFRSPDQVEHPLDHCIRTFVVARRNAPGLWFRTRTQAFAGLGKLKVDAPRCGHLSARRSVVIAQPQHFPLGLAYADCLPDPLPQR